jgi:hypothetical protein
MQKTCVEFTLIDPLLCWDADLGLSSDKTVYPNAVGTHCVIHQPVLVARTLQSDVKQIMSFAIQQVHFVKSNA